MIDEKSESAWLEAFIPIHEEASIIVDKVTEAVNSENEQAAAESLKYAIEHLPFILERLKALPKPKDKDIKEIKNSFHNSYKVFLDGCSYGITYLETPSPWNRSVWWITNDVATTKLEEANSLYYYCFPPTDADGCDESPKHPKEKTQ
ncbi:MAG: hypothetical protein E4H31_03270 [Dehalococcoidia bacterium]|nr:MAG: hypothetical protein E4H31_03270 [Dehalococcoidia bacterium]